MMFWLTVGVVVLVLLALGYRYDREHRRLGDAPTGKQMNATGTARQAEAQAKGGQWNGMSDG